MLDKPIFAPIHGRPIDLMFDEETGLCAPHRDHDERAGL